MKMKKKLVPNGLTAVHAKKPQCLRFNSGWCKSQVWSQNLQIQAIETQNLDCYTSKKLSLSVLSIRWEDGSSLNSFLRRTYWRLTWQMMFETFVIT